jgi:hypothetical protein
MKTITLNIPRRFRSDKIINTTHAENWGELTSSQFIALVRAINNKISEDDLLVEMLNIPHSVIKRLDMMQRYYLGKLLTFIQNRAPFKHFVIKDVEHLYAPADGLSDVTFGEFIFIDTFYTDYQQSNSDEDLLKLIACLYVKHNKQGERVKFTGKVNTSLAKNIHPLKRKAIAMNYDLIRSWLEKNYPEVFPTSSSPVTDKGKTKAESNGWIDVFDCIVGDDLINSDKYFDKPCAEILRYMDKKIKTNRKKKRKK